MNRCSRLGSYLLLDVLGAGGTCTVYRARHIDLGTELALKVLPHGQKLQEPFVRRLRREAAAGIRIDHPRIVKVVEHDCFRVTTALGPARTRPGPTDANNDCGL